MSLRTLKIIRLICFIPFVLLAIFSLKNNDWCFFGEYVDGGIISAILMFLLLLYRFPLLCIMGIMLIIAIVILSIKIKRKKY